MNKETLKSKWDILQRYLMTGISYMIPVVVGAGMLMGIGGIAGQIMGFEVWSPEALESTNGVIQTFAWITQVAGKGLMNLMYPVFAAFLAYAIGEKLALTPGFLGGVLAQSMGSGFIGSILIGLIAGYFVNAIAYHLSPLEDKTALTFRQVLVHFRQKKYAYNFI